MYDNLIRTIKSSNLIVYFIYSDNENNKTRKIV